MCEQNLYNPEPFFEVEYYIQLYRTAMFCTLNYKQENIFSEFLNL